MGIIDEFDPPPPPPWLLRSGAEISGFPAPVAAPIAATVAERSPAEAAEAYERAVHEVNARLAAEFAERAAAERMAERVAAEAETLRWFGDAETARIVRRWRALYGEDDRAPSATKWAYHNFKWLDANTAMNGALADIPSTAERYRIKVSLVAHLLPTQSIGSFEGRALMIAFLRADPGEPAIARAIEIISSDRWTFMHSVARTFLRHLSREILDGDPWGYGNLPERIRGAIHARRQSRGFGRLARRQGERDRRGWCSY